MYNDPAYFEKLELNRLLDQLGRYRDDEEYCQQIRTQIEKCRTKINEINNDAICKSQLQFQSQFQSQLRSQLQSQLRSKLQSQLQTEKDTNIDARDIFTHYLIALLWIIFIACISLLFSDLVIRAFKT